MTDDDRFPLPMRVADRRPIAPDVVELTLCPADGSEVPGWSAGAHIDLALGDGRVRQYSLCGTSDNRDRFRIAVLREEHGRGGSRHVHDHVTVGDLLDVTAVRNTFPVDLDRPAVLLAGGIGITPLLAMAAELERSGADWELHYGGRSIASMAYVDELGRFPGRVVLHPQDEVGVLPLADLVARSRARSASVYACGPGPMLDALRAVAGGADGPDLHVERFAGADGAGTGDRAFTVRLVRSGTTLTVAPAESLLDVLEDHGADVMSSCRSGICGTCEVAVLSGRPDHRDTVLTDEERASGTTILPCVSRASTTHLDLDL